MAARIIPPERLDEIERRLLRAEAPVDFVPDLAKEWKRCTRAVWKYVAIVRKRLAARAKSQDPDADREMIRGLALETYRTAREGNEKGPDAKAMVASLKLLSDLTGAAAPVKVDVTSAGKPFALYLPHEDGDPPK